MSSSDEEEQTIVDGDSCDANEIASLFKLACNISSEEAISLKKSYILHLNNSRLVLLFSDALNVNCIRLHIKSVLIRSIQIVAISIGSQLQIKQTSRSTFTI